MTNDLHALRRVLLTLAAACGLLPGLACVKLSQNVKKTEPPNAPAQSAQIATRGGRRLNLNTATAAELEKLPGIGEALAARIVAHREQYGRFRRAEHLMMVRGLSDRRFREIRELISVE